MKRFYISDLHLLHENCIKFDNRPFENMEEMMAVIYNNWNNTVTNGDEVYILGDISFRGKNEDLISFVSRLKGQKILVKGNHDDVSDYRYKQLFKEVVDYKEIQDNVLGRSYRVVLSHYPILSWNNMSHGSILLYGHTHKSKEDEYFQKCLKEMREYGCYHLPEDKRVMAFNVGCMHDYINYTPTTLEDILVKTSPWFKEGMKELDYLKEHLNEYKSYNNVDEMLKAVLEDEEKE